MFRDRNVYALGVECLLAYYGLDHNAVKIHPSGSFTMIAPDGQTLVDCKMEEMQFLEVNWFTKWTENLDERILMKEAKKLYGEGDYRGYLDLVPTILQKFLNRVEGVSVKQESQILNSLIELGIEPDLVEESKETTFG